VALGKGLNPVIDSGEKLRKDRYSSEACQIRFNLDLEYFQWWLYETVA
jgi:hypothetical protein